MATIYQRSGAYRAMIRRRGQVLSRTFDDRESAERWAAVEEGRIAKAATAAQVRKAPAGMSVADLFDRYAREVSPTKGGELWEVRQLARLAKDFAVAGVDIDAAYVAEWRDKRMKEVSPSSVNRELCLMSAVLKRAIKEWRLPLSANPFRNIQWPRSAPSRRRRVSDAERASVLKELGWDGAATPTTTKQWIAWTFCVALETMMRRGEILGLTRRHLYCGKRHCHIPKTKNGYPRDVPLSTKALALFAMVPDGHPDSRIVPVNENTFGIYFREAVKNVGIVDLHFHDSRREALTRISKKFANPLELGAASGHRDYRSIKIYYAPDIADLADKLD